MPDLSEYRITTPVVPEEGRVTLVHEGCAGEMYLRDPSISTVLKHVTIHEVVHHPRTAAAEPEVDEPCCYGYIRTNGRGAHEVDCPSLGRRKPPSTPDKPVAPYPLMDHNPDDRCRHPQCEHTNWGGNDRLHLRGRECPPDEGWVAKGDAWDREHYRSAP